MALFVYSSSFLFKTSSLLRRFRSYSTTRHTGEALRASTAAAITLPTGRHRTQHVEGAPPSRPFFLLLFFALRHDLSSLFHILTSWLSFIFGPSSHYAFA